MESGIIATGSADHVVRLWDPSMKPADAFKKELIGHHGSVTSLAVRSDNILVSGSGDKTIILWDTETEEFLQSPEEHAAAIVRIGVLENNFIITAGWDGSLKMWY